MLRVEDWGFTTGGSGELCVGGVPAEELARAYGTPLHVLDEDGIARRTREIRAAFADGYPGDVAVHYALKCNNTPGVVRLVREAGLRPEVGTPYEWELCRRLGVPARQVLVNGPNKGVLLGLAAEGGAGGVVLDSLAEIAPASRAAETAGRPLEVLLRVNPDCVPRGMNRATATGSRRSSVFGLDHAAGEVETALDAVHRAPGLRFLGFHLHVGTGIRRPEDFARPIEILVTAMRAAQARGLATYAVDLGGGFGVPTSRELNTREFLVYQALGRLPGPPRASRFPGIRSFGSFLGDALARACRRDGLPLPKLLLEPGRSVVSGAGVLLIRVSHLKPRRGVGTWAVTDGGTGTVAFPLHYEYHEVFRCRAAHAPRRERYHLVGSACFSADWIYRNKRLPALEPNDLLAILDAGAYFTVQESNFGFPRPAIVGVRAGVSRVLRRRETFEDMVSRDVAWENGHAV